MNADRFRELSTNLKRDDYNAELMSFMELPEAYQITPEVIGPENPIQARVQGCVILKHAVMKFWNNIPADERENIRNYVAEQCVAGAESDGNESFMPYIYGVLSAIIVRDWPQAWPNIMDELLSSALSSPGLKKWNLKLISNIAKDVLEFSKGVITSNRHSQLKKALSTIAPHVLEIIEQIMAESSELNEQALECLGAIVKWLDPNFFFTSEFIVQVTEQCLQSIEYQPFIFDIFAEFVIGDATSPDDSSTCLAVAEMFEKIITIVSNTLPETEEAASEMYLENPRLTNSFIYMVHSFSSKFLKAIESSLEAVNIAMTVIVNLMNVVDTTNDVFKNCCDICQIVARRYYFDSSLIDAARELYGGMIDAVRTILICKITQPPDVIISIGDNMNVIRNSNDTSQMAEYYNSARQALVLVTNCDPNGCMEEIFSRVNFAAENFATDTDLKVEQKDFLNHIAWAVGALGGGAIPASEEKRFVLHVLQVYLAIFDAKKRESDLISIGSNIMFIISRFPSFLLRCPQVLVVMMNKLIEFMLESNPELKEMAVTTFRTLCRECRSAYTSADRGQDLNPIISYIPDVVESLESSSTVNAITFYDGLAQIIAGVPNESDKADLLNAVMESADQRFTYIVGIFDVNNEEIVKTSAILLAYNSIVAQTVKSSFFERLHSNYANYLELYNICGGNIQQVLDEGGDITWLNNARASAVSIVTSFFSDYKVNKMRTILTDVIGIIMERVVDEFPRVPPEGRVPEALVLIENLIHAVQSTMDPEFPRICENMVSPAVEMIREDHESFIDIRMPLISLVKELVSNCFRAILNIETLEGIDLIFSTIVHMCNDPRQNICTTAISTLYELFSKIDSASSPEHRAAFYEAFYLRGVVAAFSLLTDTVHKFAFRDEVRLIYKLLHLTAPMNDAVPIAEAISELFENRDVQWLEGFVTEIKTMTNKELENSLMDFLITIKEYSPYDLELQPEVMEAQANAQKQENEQIPGFIPQQTDSSMYNPDDDFV